MTKTWKIGEYCVGGIIRATTKKGNLMIEIIDQLKNKGEVLYTEFLNVDATKGEIREVLSEYTTFYYADKLADYIAKKI